MAKIKIENVVASTSLGEELDLQAIALALEGAEYEPEQFPGLIYRLKEPKTATFMFRSGKVVCTGAKSLEHVKVAIERSPSRSRRRYRRENGAKVRSRTSCIIRSWPRDKT
jgi:transcription initiation factor TFIID TATA-box-binding protein